SPSGSSVNEIRSFEQMLERYEGALGKLTTWGIAVAPTSRLHAYHRRLSAALANGHRRMPQAVFDRVIFDFREMDEIIAIVTGVSDPPLPEELRRLRPIASGTEHPDDEVASEARDLQYELYLAVKLSAAGVKVKLG